MKRYILFTFEVFYPDGGWNDFGGDFDTIEDAKSAFASRDMALIVDCETKKVVWRGERRHEPINTSRYKSRLVVEWKQAER